MKNFYFKALFILIAVLFSGLVALSAYFVKGEAPTAIYWQKQAQEKDLIIMELAKEIIGLQEKYGVKFDANIADNFIKLDKLEIRITKSLE